jgi:hypothetical protein
MRRQDGLLCSPPDASARIVGLVPQVKVWLGDKLDHYYVLSRFLICRMLTVTKIPEIKVQHWLDVPETRACFLLAGCRRHRRPGSNANAAR